MYIDVEAFRPEPFAGLFFFFFLLFVIGAPVAADRGFFAKGRRRDDGGERARGHTMSPNSGSYC
jgi:hypothetical protein